MTVPMMNRYEIPGSLDAQARVPAMGLPAPRPPMDVAPALVRVFFRTWAWVILGTVLCAVAVVPPLAPFAAATGLAVGIAIGPVLALINTVVSGTAFKPLASPWQYRRWTRGLMYGLVVLTIGTAGVLIIGNVATNVARTGKNLEHILYAVLYAIYIVAVCLWIARWVGGHLGDSHARLVRPDLFHADGRAPGPQPSVEGLPWG